MRSLAIFIALSGSIPAVLAGTAGTPWTIDVNAVPLQQKATWCQGETNTCTLLCPVAPLYNNCTTSTLEFTCTCQNGSAPGLQYYSQTMPTFICEQAFTDCITANVGNKTGQDNCFTSIKDHCGNLTAAAVQTTSSSAMPTATGADNTASASGSASATNAAPTTSSSKAAAPTNVYYYGNGAAVVAFGLFAYLV